MTYSVSRSPLLEGSFPALRTCVIVLMSILYEGGPPVFMSLRDFQRRRYNACGSFCLAFGIIRRETLTVLVSFSAPLEIRSHVDHFII